MVDIQLIRNIQLYGTAAGSYRSVPQRHIRQAVYRRFKLLEVRRCGLEGMHMAGCSRQRGEHACVYSDVCTDIRDDHAR